MRVATRMYLVPVLLLSIELSVAQPAVPKFQTYQPVTLSASEMQINTQAYFQERFLNNPMLPNLNPVVQQQNLRILQQSGMVKQGPPTVSQEQQLKEIEKEEKMEDYKATIQHFQEYLHYLQQLNPDSFSIIKATYLSEAVYYDHPPSFQEFEKAIQQRAGFAKQLLQQQGLSEKNNLALNYAIQQLSSHDNIIHEPKTGKSYLIKKLQYNFEDFDGEKDWTNMFVTKILQTNKGQCHSLPLLYLCIAEQLHAKAYLSLAPNHSFIQFFDSKGRQYNFETTNGHLVSTEWLMQSDAINVTAFKNRTYLDTLSSRKLYAQCMADLQMAYLAKNGYDQFAYNLSQQILKIDSTNINALMELSNDAFYTFKNLQKQAANPPKEKWGQYPLIQKAYDDMADAQQRVKQTGYQDMPEEQYKAWLKSIDQEKQKERYKKEQEKLMRQVQQVKK